MSQEIRPIAAGELRDFMIASRRAFGFEIPSDEEIEVMRPLAELDRTLAVFEGSKIVATAAAISFQLSVPGGFLPMAGVAVVTVLPTHRRQGLLRALMRRQLDDVRAAGEPLAGLFASQAPIYGRFGYGASAYHASFEVASQVPFAGHVEVAGRPALLEREEAVRIFPEVWEAARRLQPGMVSLSAERWRVKLADRPGRRQGGTEHYRVAFEEDGKATGYALYRLHPVSGEPRHELRLLDLIATTPRAYGALWRYLLDVDLVGRVIADQRPLDEPLALLLADRRALRLRHPEGVGEALWLRLVDLPAALAGRRYTAEGGLVFEVADAFLPASAGRFRLEVSRAGATCQPARSAPDLVLDTSDLAAAYLGGTRFATLARAGRVEERTAGALARADAMFFSDPPPWCPYFF